MDSMLVFMAGLFILLLLVIHIDSWVKGLAGLVPSLIIYFLCEIITGMRADLQMVTQLEFFRDKEFWISIGIFYLGVVALDCAVVSFLKLICSIVRNRRTDPKK